MWKSAWLLAVLSILALPACDDEDEKMLGEDNGCGEVTEIAETSPGNVTAMGAFHSSQDEQPLIVLTNAQGTTQQFPAASWDGTTATFASIGVPPGTYTVSFVVSGCTDDQHHDPGHVTFHADSDMITIH